MLYNLKSEYDCVKLTEEVARLKDKKAIVELKEKRPQRTMRQNSYLHIVLSYYASEFGYTLEEVKVDIFKRLVNKEIFEEEITNKHGQKITRLRSSSNLDTKEMTIAIERFRFYSSSVCGLYIPAPDEQEALIYAQQQIERAVMYL